MYMVFKGKPTSEAECIACEAQVSAKRGDILVAGGLHRDENNHVVIEEGKQPIVRWDNVAKAYNQDIWYIRSPQKRDPYNYKDLVAGFDFELKEKIPEDWEEPIEE